MNTAQLGALIVTLVADDLVCMRMSKRVVAALCAVNMLLALESEDFLVDGRREFKDFTISARERAANIDFKHDNVSIAVDRRAIEHLQAAGNLRALRLCANRAKL